MVQIGGIAYITGTPLATTSGVWVCVTKVTATMDREAHMLVLTTWWELLNALHRDPG